MRIINRKFKQLERKGCLLTSKNLNIKILEQYRTIRTNFYSSKNSHNLRTVLISSPSRNEGKSTTASNFAITLAQQGKKVLLIDADLRNPSLHFFFKTDNTFGLCDVLRGNTVFENTISKTEISGLDILSSGGIPFNPTELLGSIEMEKFIKTVIGRYDMVIIDSPPILEVADAKVIANQCDGLIMVLRWRKTKSEEVIEVNNSLKSIRAKLLGVILNERE